LWVIFPKGKWSLTAGQSRVLIVKLGARVVVIGRCRKCMAEQSISCEKVQPSLTDAGGATTRAGIDL
jgi:hypothetical protein